MPPGKYTVRLKIGDQSDTQPLTILRDPRAPRSDADIELSVKTLRRISADIDHVSDTVNQIEWLRKQIEVIETMLRPPKKKEKEKPVVDEVDADFQKVMKEDLPALNRTFADRSFAALVAPLNSGPAKQE